MARSLFISHGSPSLVIDDIPARHFLANLAQQLPRPRAIVLISAHNIAGQTQVGAARQWQEWHDFRGFAPELYQMQYRPQGDPALAAQIAAGLARLGENVVLSEASALDHGAWVPLKLIYPAADIPLVTISLSRSMDNAAHWALGERLGRVLANELAGRELVGEVLLIASGSITHNLSDAFKRLSASESQSVIEPYAAEFIADCYAALDTFDADAWLSWQQRLRWAQRAHPTPEHFLPLLIARAAAGVQAPVTRLHQSMELGVLGMDVLGFDWR